MKTFILRNSTVENLFGSTDLAYSGYGDISYVDPSADTIIWFYLVPFKSNSSILSKEIDSYKSHIELIYQQIQSNKTFIVFTLASLFEIKYQNTNSEVNQAINSFNQYVTRFASEHLNVKVIDLMEFLRNYSLDQLVDWKYYLISKMQINPKLAPAFKKWFNRRLEEIQLKRKKCLVLDLDNTLWGGVLGEDGITGIKIGGDYPGNAFQLFQEFLVELGKNGIILTVCSKNNEQDVFEVWKQNPNVPLREEHFAAHRINWQNKADNIKELAEELNIGLDSMVFIDDNPTERELVKQMLPMVEVPDFPGQPYLLPAFTSSLVTNYFRIYSLSEEDKNKTHQYKANAERVQSQKKFSDFSDYLKSLVMELTIESANSFNISRIAQMTQKTNQFNLTTRRYTDADIYGFVNNGSYIYCLSVKDKFGDNGITGCIIIHKETDNKQLYIDTLLLSCRILGKGIEAAFINKVLEIMKDKRFEQLNAEYIASSKNNQVEDFYDRMGFVLIEEKDGSKKYRIDLLREKFRVEDYYKIKIV